MESILLTTPAQQKYSNPTVELKPKKVVQWLAELPILNPIISAKALSEAIHGLNEQSIKPKDRFQLLELFRAPVNDIFKSFDAEAIRRLPVSAKLRILVKEDIHTLCSELANGYKLIVKQSVAEHLNPQKDSLFLHSIHHAMEQIVHSILQIYRMGGALPLFSVLELHQLFSYAMQKTVQEVAIPLAGAEAGSESIAFLYKKIMLILISDPFKMEEGDVFFLYCQIDALIGFCDIQSGMMGIKKNRYLIKPKEDRGPRELEASMEATEGCYSIDFNPVFDLMVAKARDAREKNKELTPDELRVAKILGKHLAGYIERKDPRVEAHRDVRVIFGVDAICYFLEEGADKLGEKAGENFGIQMQEEGAEPKYAFEDWAVLNESVKGYLLATKHPNMSLLKVGSALGIHVPVSGSNERKISVAVIRWVRGGANGATELGAEIMPGNPHAVHCVSVEQPPAFAACQAFFMPALPVLAIPSSLLAPKGIFSAGREIQVIAKAKSTLVQANSIVMETACLDRFDFIAVAKTESE